MTWGWTRTGSQLPGQGLGPVRFAEQAETLFRLICCERKTLFRLKKQHKSMDYKRNEHSLIPGASSA